MTTLEQPDEEHDELYCWKVEGLTSEFTGYYAEEEAKATAKRISGTCQAYPLYVRPQPLAVERERNFCERCGKRLGGSDHVHTCTSPQPASQAVMEQQPVAWLTEAAWGIDVSLEKPDFGNAKWKAPRPKVTPLYAFLS